MPSSLERRSEAEILARQSNEILTKIRRIVAEDDADSEDILTLAQELHDLDGKINELLL